MFPRFAGRRTAGVTTLALSLVITSLLVSYSHAQVAVTFVDVPFRPGAVVQYSCRATVHVWHEYDDVRQAEGAIVSSSTSDRIHQISANISTPARLVITATQASDNGTRFVCYYVEGGIDVAVRLILLPAPPQANPGPFRTEVEGTGSSVQLGCPFGAADLPVTTIWRNSSDTVLHTGTTSDGSQNYSLRAIAANSGNYTCQATNSDGTQTYTVQFLVEPCAPIVTSREQDARPLSILVDVDFPCPASGPLLRCWLMYTDTMTMVETTQNITTTLCNAGMVTSLETATSLHVATAYSVTAFAENQFGSTASASLMVFAACPERSCNIKTNIRTNCYTHAERCNNRIECRAVGDYADERGCSSPILQPAGQVSAPSGTMFNLRCLVMNTTLGTDDIAWLINGRQEFLTPRQFSHFAMGSTLVLSLTVSNFSPTQQGIYTCGVLRTEPESERPLFVSNVEVQVNLTSSQSGTLLCPSPRYESTPLLSVTPEKVLYGVNEVVSFSCPFTPLYGTTTSTCTTSTTVGEDSTSGSTGGTWRPPPPICRESPILVSHSTHFEVNAMVNITCQLHLNGDTVSPVDLLDSAGNPVIRLQNLVQDLSGNPPASYSANVIAVNDESYTCVLNITVSGNQQVTLRSQPLMVNVVPNVVPKITVSPQVLIPDEILTVSCDTTDIRTVLRVQVTVPFLDPRPISLYESNSLMSGARLLGSTLIWRSVNRSVSMFAESESPSSLSTQITCQFTRFGLPTTQIVGATLLLGQRPVPNLQLPVDSTNRTAVAITVMHGLFSDGNLPTRCVLLLTRLGDNIPTTTADVPCGESGGDDIIVNVFSTQLQEGAVYNVVLNVTNAVGSATRSMAVPTGCRFNRCSDVTANVTCYSDDQICDGVVHCGVSMPEDEVGCGELKVAVPTITAAAGSDATINCTFTTYSNLSSNLRSNPQAVVDRFGPQWRYDGILSGTEEGRSARSCAPQLPFSVRLFAPVMNSTRRDGTYTLTASLRLLNIGQCTASRFICSSVQVIRPDPSGRTGSIAGGVYNSTVNRAPLLEGVTCSESLIPTAGNGIKTPLQIPDYESDRTVNFACQNGYVRVGSSRAICQPGGNWSDPAPTCQVEPELMPILLAQTPTAVATANYTILFQVNNTRFPVQDVFLFFSPDANSMQTEVGRSRYTVSSQPVNDSSDLVQYQITLMTVQMTDAGRYFVSMLREGILSEVQAPLMIVGVQGCGPQQIATDLLCVADSDGDGLPDTLDPCPLDNTNTCNPADLLGCPVNTDAVWAVAWAPVVAGTVARQPCPQSDIAFATRPCSASGTWGQADLSLCGSQQLQEYTNRVLVSSIDTVSTLAVAEADAGGLEALTTSSQLFPADLTATVSVLQILLNQQQMRSAMGTNATSDTFRQVYVNILSNIVTETASAGWMNLELVEASTESQSVLALIEDFAAFESGLTQSDVANETRTNTTSRNVALQFVALPEPQATTFLLPLPDLNITESIEIPLEAFQRSGSNRYAVASIDGLGSLLRTSFINGQSFEPNSQIITILITGPTGGREEIRDLANPIVLRLVHRNATILRDPTCGFYNFSAPRSGIASGTGAWAAEGLSRDAAASNEEADSITVCNTPHLTSFSILVSTSTLSNADATALRFISYIGCGISLFCLILTAAIFIALKSLHSDHNAIHCNLAISLGAAQILFLVGIERTEVSGVCSAFAIVLHYAFLVAFMWMLVEGLQIYFMLVQVFPSSTQRLRKYYLACYGLPVVFVAITAGVLFDDYGTETYCWIDVSSNTRWAFHGPIIGIILANIVFLVVAMRVLYKRSKKKGDTYEAAKAGFKGAVVILPLLGVTWAFGLLAVSENTLVFHYLFVIFNSLQGLFIFIMHVVRSPQVARAVRARYKRYKLHKRGMSEFTASHSTTGNEKRKTSSAMTASTALTNTRNASLPTSELNQQVEMQSRDTIGRPSRDSPSNSMELVGPGKDVNTVTSFGAKKEGPLSASPAPQKVPMSVVAMQLAEAGSDLESESSDDEQAEAHTPMLAEPPATLELKQSTEATIPSSDEEEGAGKSPLRVVGGRETAFEPPPPLTAEQASPPPVASDFGDLHSTSVSSFGKMPSPLSALPLVDEVLQSLNPTEANTLGGPAPADGSLSAPNTSEAQGEDAAPGSGRRKGPKRDWRDHTVTNEIRTNVASKVQKGAYGGLPELTDDEESSDAATA